EEERHDVEDAVGELDAVERVPDPQGVEVDGVKVVARAEDLADLTHGGFVELRVYWRNDDVIDVAGEGAFEVRREVALHGGEGNEELGVVRAGAVASVLLLFLEHAHDGVGIAGDLDGLADGGFSGEELALGVGSEHDDARGVVFVLLGHEAALRDGEGAEVLILGPDAPDGTVGRVPLADFIDALADLGRDGFDEGSELLAGDGVVDAEENVAAGGIALVRHAGFAAEHDGDVRADGGELLALLDAETDAEADEENDRGDAPEDAEHGEEAAELRLPEGSECLLEDLAKGHGGWALVESVEVRYAGA